MTSSALVPEAVTAVGHVIWAWPRAAKPRTTSASSAALVIATMETPPGFSERDVQKDGWRSMGKWFWMRENRDFSSPACEAAGMPARRYCHPLLPSDGWARGAAGRAMVAGSRLTRGG